MKCVYAHVLTWLIGLILSLSQWNLRPSVLVSWALELALVESKRSGESKTQIRKSNTFLELEYIKLLVFFLCVG